MLDSLKWYVFSFQPCKKTKYFQETLRTQSLRKVYFPLLLRTTKLAQILPSTTSYYKACANITLTRQFHWLQSLYCKSQCHCINQDSGPQTRTCMKPFLVWSAHLNSTLQWRTRPGETEHEPRPSHNWGSVPPIDAGSHFMRENMGFRTISNFQSSPWHSNSTAICKHCLANHTTTASTSLAINSMDAAIFHCDLHTRILLYNFTVEDASGRNRAWAAPVAQLRFRPWTPGATLCEKTWGFVRFQTSEHHLYAANLLPFASIALQITLQLRRPHRQSTTWMQPFHCYLRTRNLLY